MEKLRRCLLTANQTARCQCPSSRMETSIGEMFTSGVVRTESHWTGGLTSLGFTVVR
jgi:hypothetical protein